MLVYKPDYFNGAFAILEIKDYKIISEKFYAIYDWRIIFQYGNTADINFKLNEIRSKADCFFKRKEDIYSSLNDMVSLMKKEIEEFLKTAKNQKEDNKDLIKLAEEWYKKDIEECNANIKRFDKQIRDFSNLDLERELEKRGLIV